MITAFSLMALAAAASLTNAPPSSRDADILVVGERDRARQISNFVQALTPPSGASQISRFEQAACPTAVGLSPRQNAFVVERVRAIAAEAGLPRGKPGCAPNIVIMVTNDKRAFMQRLYRDHPEYFPAAWGVGRTRRLVRDRSLAAAWQFDGMISGDGVMMAQQERGAPYSRTMLRATRLRPHARYRVIASIVVVDVAALAGLSTTQLADYAAMRALTRAEPARIAEMTAPTILKGLDAPMGTPVPLTLTEWDMGFLKSLYASDKTGYATAQRFQIRQALARHLAGRDESPGSK